MPESPKVRHVGRPRAVSVTTTNRGRLAGKSPKVEALPASASHYLQVWSIYADKKLFLATCPCGKWRRPKVRHVAAQQLFAEHFRWVQNQAQPPSVSRPANDAGEHRIEWQSRSRGRWNAHCHADGCNWKVNNARRDVAERVFEEQHRGKL